MSFEFKNLSFSRVILHNVYQPDEEGAVEPFLSTSLTELAVNGRQKLEERITKVLGSNSHSLQMDVAQTGEVGCFHQATRLLGVSAEEFISNSAEIARLHTAAHTNRSWPGGTLVIIEGTAGASNKRCLFIVKAEQQAGFIEKEVDDRVLIEYIESLILTPQAKLYKVGVFVELAQDSIGESPRNTGDFEAYVFDSNIKAKDDRKAARYFYSSFLGLRIPENAEQRTRDFFEYTKEFIGDVDISNEMKVDLQQALNTYLKTDQGTTIHVAGFAEQFMNEELRDDYSFFMRNKNFPQNAIQKDTQLIKRRLATRKMNFSTSVKLTAPAESFEEMITILESTAEHTTVRIQGQLTEQQ
ncbi:nucleoid-associated protein [Ferrimonas futtsuensis]|uniref:nucleoid-associated protein n=1 Tax=Ferrimonas futtsuensis TaxID=364764 RepID=UPI000420EEC7|nr:nucleoid-associated protein [Ferrimonas futtsuensis]